MLQKATINFYRITNDRNFGFAIMDYSGEKVYINQLSFRVPQFTGGDLPLLADTDYFEDPCSNDKILLTHSETRLGLKANVWCYLDTYMEVMESINNRPMYKFVQHMGPEKVSKLTPLGYLPPTTLWEGKNLMDLNFNYSKRSRPVVSSDHFRTWFEKLDLSTGKWVKCDDPR